MVAGTAAHSAVAIGWAQLYAELRPTLARALAAATGSYEGVEDAIQDAFASVLRRDPASFDSPEAWLYTVALNRLRKQRRRAAILARLPFAPRSDPNELDQVIRRTDLARALFVLPQRDRELLVAKHYIGMSQEQIASYMHLPRGTVSAAISRALARLRELEARR